MSTPLLAYEKVKTKVIQPEDIRITAADFADFNEAIKNANDSPHLKFFDYPSMLNPNIKPMPPEKHKKLLELIEKWGKNHKVVFTHELR